MKTRILFIITLIAISLSSCLSLKKYSKEVIIEVEDTSFSPELLINRLTKRLDVYGIDIVSSEKLPNGNLVLICGFYKEINQSIFKKLIETPGRVTFHKGLPSHITSTIHQKLNEIIVSDIQQNNLPFKEHSISSIFSTTHNDLVLNYIGRYNKSAFPIMNDYLKNSKIDSLISHYIKNYTFAFNHNREQQNVTMYVFDATVRLSSDDVSSVRHGINQFGNDMITIEFNGAGSKKFEELTDDASTNGSTIPIVYNNAVLTNPIVTMPIKGGKAEISGYFTDAQLNEIVAILASGPLPKIKVMSIKKLK